MEDETDFKSELDISETITLPNEPVEVDEPLMSPATSKLEEAVTGKVILILAPVSVMLPDSILPFPCAIITLLSVKFEFPVCIGILYSEPD